MRSKLFTTYLTIFILNCFSLTVFADDKIAIGPKISTLGGGLAAHYNLNEAFNIRGGINAFDYNFDGTESNVDYDIDLSWMSFDVLLDWFPFSNGFRVSTGVIINQNEVDLSAAPGFTSINIGGTVYTAAQIGSLTGNIEFNEIGPYVGIGWGNPFGKESKWSLNFDLGVFFQGSPEASLSTTGSLANNAGFLTSLNTEVSQLEDEIKDYQYYPVAGVSLTRKF